MVNKVLNVKLKGENSMSLETKIVQGIKEFCIGHGFKEVKIVKENRFVKSVSNKEWFAVEILEDKIKLSYENYSLEKPFVRDNNLNNEYIQYLIEIGRLDEFIKKEFIRFVTNVYYYVLNH